MHINISWPRAILNDLAGREDGQSKGALGWT